MVFPNWGAISANIVNAQNRKGVGLVDEYKPTRKATKKDLIIGLMLMVVPAIILWITFIVIMYVSN